MPLTATPMSEAQEPFSVLLYGNSGAGKTSFALGNLPDAMRPAIILNTDKGLSSVMNPARNAGIMELKADNVSDFMVVQKFAALSDTHPQKPDWLRGVRTFVWDSLTSFVDESVLENAASPDSDTRSPYQAGQRDYLISQGQALALFDNLKRLGYNQIVITGTSDKEGKHGFALPPGLTERIIYRFSYVFKVHIVQNSKTGENVHVLSTAPTSARETIKVRNSRFRQRLMNESSARLKQAGWAVAPGNTGFLLLADPLDLNPPAYQITMADLFTWYQEEVLDKRS